jgi:hypothetical protein
VIAPGIGFAVTGGSFAGAPGFGMAAGVATERDSQSIAERGGGVSSAAAALAKKTISGRQIPALVSDIQLDRHSHVALLRLQIAQISIAYKPDERDEG